MFRGTRLIGEPVSGPGALPLIASSCGCPWVVTVYCIKMAAGAKRKNRDKKLNFIVRVSDCSSIFSGLSLASSPSPYTLTLKPLLRIKFYLGAITIYRNKCKWRVALNIY